MKLSLITMATAAMLTFAPAQMTAQNPPPANPPTNSGSGVPKQDGTGPKVRKGKGQGQGNSTPRMGKKTGPRDGTGPIHTPQGGGGGRRGGRK